MLTSAKEEPMFPVYAPKSCISLLDSGVNKWLVTCVHVYVEATSTPMRNGLPKLLEKMGTVIAVTWLRTALVVFGNETRALPQNK
jgi:hypothetical protein